MAKADLWMPLFVGDYQKDTSRLSLAEHGAYLKLLMDYWVNGPPRDDDAEMCRVLGCSLREWRKIRPKIVRFFSVFGGVWNHKRVDAERAAADARKDRASDKARQAATARWERERAAAEAAQALETVRGAMLEAMPGALPGAMPEGVLASCPLPSPSSVPTEQASETPDARAWREAVVLLTRNGSMKESAARTFFGGLLKGGLPAHRLLPSIVAAQVNGTLDPRGYLKGCARALVEGGEAAKPAPNVAGWPDSTWRHALAGYRETGAWADEMGPKPGEPGCWVPPHVLSEAAAA